MKKVLLSVAIIGLLFACKKEEETGCYDCQFNYYINDTLDRINSDTYRNICDRTEEQIRSFEVTNSEQSYYYNYAYHKIVVVCNKQ